jgi:hypothetical protein
MQLLDVRFARAGYPKTVAYTESDLPERWKKQWKQRDSFDSEYYKKETSRKLTYTLNSQGYREKEWKDIDWDNSFVFLGCSHTFGVGVDHNETIPMLMQQKTGINCINLGIPGGSNMFSVMNSAKLINYGINPLKVFFQKTYSNRWFYYDETLQTQKENKHIDFKTEKFLDNEISGIIKSQWKDKVIEYEIEMFDDCWNHKYIARDGCHFNNKYFDRVTNKLLDK